MVSCFGCSRLGCGSGPRVVPLGPLTTASGLELPKKRSELKVPKDRSLTCGSWIGAGGLDFSIGSGSDFKSDSDGLGSSVGSDLRFSSYSSMSS